MSSLNVAFYFNASLALLAAAASALRGKKYVYGREEEMESISVRIPSSTRRPATRVTGEKPPSTMIGIGANEGTTSIDGGKCDSNPESVKALASTKDREEPVK
jgi:hypothetical protein